MSPPFSCVCFHLNSMSDCLTKGLPSAIMPYFPSSFVLCRLVGWIQSALLQSCLPFLQSSPEMLMPVLLLDYLPATLIAKFHEEDILLPTHHLPISFLHVLLRLLCSLLHHFYSIRAKSKVVPMARATHN